MYFHHDRHEVVGAVVRVFADEARRVSANGVEIAKNGDVIIGVGDTKIMQDLFNHVFGLTVRVGDILADGAIFGETSYVASAVYGGRG